MSELTVPETPTQVSHYSEQSSALNNTKTTENIQQSSKQDGSATATDPLAYLHEQQAILASTKEDDAYYPVTMANVALAMVDYHVCVGSEGQDMLSRALRLAKSASTIAQKSSEFYYLAFFALLTILETLYKETKDTAWLHKALEPDNECIRCIPVSRADFESDAAVEYYARCCTLFSNAFQYLFEEDGRLEWIEKAVKYQGYSVKSTDISSTKYVGRAEIFDKRFKLYTELMVRLVDGKPDLDSTNLIKQAFGLISIDSISEVHRRISRLCRRIA